MHKEAVADEPLLTPGDVAKQLVVECATLAAWRGKKPHVLPFVKVGALVRYRRADVQAFIQSRLRCAA